jgi:hypothetical protein
MAVMRRAVVMTLGSLSVLFILVFSGVGRAGPHDGNGIPTVGTRYVYYSHPINRVVVGVQEYGCPPSTYMANWGEETPYYEVSTFLCAQEP